MADPLDVLHQPVVPVAPREEFAAQLRAELEEALGFSTATTPRAPTPTQPAVSVYLCASDASAAIDFYRTAFGAVETLRMTADDGRVGHAEVTIAGITVMLSDEYPEIGVISPQTLGGTGTTVQLRVDDVDATYERALAAGAAGERAPADQFHGNRTATLHDPAGHRWMLTQPVEEVSAEELARRAPDYTVDSASISTEGVPDLSGELGYFTLSAPDVARAVAFYGALFGWRFGPVEPGSTGHRYSHVDNTSVPFGIHADPGDPSPHHYYRVDDLATMTARVRALGGQVLEVAEHPSGGTARCRDDQGVEFDLWQAAPGY